MKLLDVVSLGDLILNFAYAGMSPGGFDLYERQPAGATANLLSQVVRLGGTGALISTVGDDYHGKYLYDYARKEGIDVSNVILSKDLSTRMMFVHFKEDNDRYFPDYYSRRTDVETRMEDIDVDIVKGCKAFAMSLFFYLKDKPIYRTSQKLLKIAEEQGSLVGLDCNWRGEQTSREVSQAICDAALNSDIVKLTDVELEHYFGETDLLRGTEKILGGKTKIVAVTLGKDGCLLRNRNGYVYRPTYDVDVADTTGAGDSFMGSLLYQLTRDGCNIDRLGTGELAEIADFSNACSSYSTSHRGSMAAMATMENVKWVVENVPKRAPVYPC